MTTAEQLIEEFISEATEVPKEIAALAKGSKAMRALKDTKGGIQGHVDFPYTEKGSEEANNFYETAKKKKIKVDGKRIKFESPYSIGRPEWINPKSVGIRRVEFFAL